MNYSYVWLGTIDMIVVVWCRNRMNYSHNSNKCSYRRVVVWCRNRMNYSNWAPKADYQDVVVWCRNRMNYSYGFISKINSYVVVWCRNRMNYSRYSGRRTGARLWFDVEIEWITARNDNCWCLAELWFDVEKIFFIKDFPSPSFVFLMLMEMRV